MPNYDYHCSRCGVDFEETVSISERHQVRHEECGKFADLVFWKKMRKPHVFRAGFFPHLDKEPVYAGSKQQLKDECNKRDKFMPYAWD